MSFPALRISKASPCSPGGKGGGTSRRVKPPVPGSDAQVGLWGEAPAWTLPWCLGALWQDPQLLSKFLLSHFVLAAGWGGLYQLSSLSSRP